MIVYLEYAVTVFLILRMSIVGFSGPPGRFLSWPMFAVGGATRVDGWILHRPADTPVELRLADYAMRGDIVFDKESCWLLVEWLSAANYRVWGTITIYDEDGYREVPFDSVESPG